MITQSCHLLAEYYGCTAETLNDVRVMEDILRAGAAAAGATVVGSVFHQFSPHGVTGVVVVQESHLSAHTWPEAGYVAVDIFTCGGLDPTPAHELMERAFSAERSQLLYVTRGRGDGPPVCSRTRAEALEHLP